MNDTKTIFTPGEAHELAAQLNAEAAELGDDWRYTIVYAAGSSSVCFVKITAEHDDFIGWL